MPRLPDVTALGGRPVPQDGTPIVPVRNAGAEAQGAEQAALYGARAAGALQGGTDVLAQAEQKIQTQRDAVELVRAVGSYNEKTAAELRRLSTESDLSALDTTKAYGAFLAKEKETMLAAFPGSETAKLRLAARLEDVLSTRAGEVAALGHAAQQKLVSDQLGVELNKVMVAPGTVEQKFQSWQGIVKDAAPGLTSDMERALERSGLERISVAQVTRFSDMGNYDEARKALSSLGQYISAEAQQGLSHRITLGQYEGEKRQRELQAKINLYTQVNGKPPDAALLSAMITGIQPREERQTLADRVREYEGAMRVATRNPGFAASPDQIQRLAGASTPEDRPFGGGITGRALEIMTDEAPAFAAGLLTETQERRFLSAVTQYAQPAQFNNPDTGLIETRRPELPPFVAEAFKRRGMAIPQSPATSPGGGGAPDPNGTQSTQHITPPPHPGQSVWGLASLISGPIPAAGEAIGRTPLIGSLMPAPQMTQARNYVPQMQRDLVRVLQNNPRYAEGERKAIEQEISIEPSIYDNPTAFRNRLVGIDDALQVRMRNAYNTINNPGAVGRDERVQAMNVMNALVQFRESLGVPPRVKTPDEAKKLPPGSQFIDPQGNIRQVPPQ